MRHRFDQLGKVLGVKALEVVGRRDRTNAQFALNAETLYADLRHEPDPERGKEREELGLLGRIAIDDCMIEIRSEPPGPEDFRACLAKHLMYWQQRDRDVRGGADRDPPQLWIISSGMPRRLFAGIAFVGAEGWPEGVYRFGGETLRVALVVANELRLDPSVVDVLREPARRLLLGHRHCGHLEHQVDRQPHDHPLARRRHGFDRDDDDASHHAFLRDIACFATALEGIEAGDSSRVAAVGEEWKRFRAALHGHHTVEDTSVFPGLREGKPELAVAIDELEGHHRAIDPLLERADVAFADLPAQVASAREVVAALHARVPACYFGHMDGGLAIRGDDGLVEYLAARLAERGYAVVSCDEPQVYIRVVDPTRQDFGAHVAEVTAAAQRMGRGVTISIVTRHGDKGIARYKRASREARVAHGVAGVRSIGIVTGDVRDPARTGLTPVDPKMHERLFPGTLDPEAIVLAIEVTLDLDGCCVSAGELTPWLNVGAGTVRDAVRAITGANQRSVRERLVAAGVATRVQPDTAPEGLVGHELATYWVPRIRPRDCAADFDDRDDDPSADADQVMVEAWAGAINAGLDKVAAKLVEPRRAWTLDREHVAFTTAREWALLASRR